jgi:hypothetical protein
LHDEALLLKTTANELVNRLEPVLQLWITIGIAIDVVESVEKVIEAGRVGESFDKGLEFCQRCLIVT